MNPSARQPRPRPRAELLRLVAGMEGRLAELRRDPQFIDAGSDVEVEHRLTSIRLARFRAELQASAPERERRTLASKTRY